MATVTALTEDDTKMKWTKLLDYFSINFSFLKYGIMT